MEAPAGPSGSKVTSSDEEIDKLLQEGSQVNPSLSSDIPNWMFEFDENDEHADFPGANDLVSPQDHQTLLEESQMDPSCPSNKVSIYKTPKSRLPPTIEYPTQDLETTPKKVRSMPLPLLNWADSEEIWQNIVYKEEVNLKLRNYKMFDDRSTYLPRMRAILLDWIMEVCEVYHLRRNTYFLAIDYIDRYLTVKPTVPKTQLQLLGVACLFIAAKLEEIYPPKLSEFSYVCDGACTEKEILACEILLLNTLQWEVNPMTPTSWLNLYMQIHHNADDFRKHKLNLDMHFQYPQYSAYKFVKASHLIDLFSMDPGFLRFSYSMVAAAAIYYIYDKATALSVSGLKWKQLKSCVMYMSVFNCIVQESLDPRLISIMPNIEDERLDRSFRFLRKNIPKLLKDENHSIQTHLIDLDYFERSVVLRLQLYGLSVKKVYVNKVKNDDCEEFESATQESTEKGPSVVMYELTPAKENLNLIDDSPVLHPTDADYEPGKINIFKINQKMTVTFDDILSSIHNDSKMVKITRALRDPKKSCWKRP